MKKTNLQELSAPQLFHTCDPDQFDFQTTAELEPLEQVLGQPRAVEAFRLAVDIDADGYNIFALGRPGIGKLTLVHQMLDRQATEKQTPEDWCYVNNFDDATKPQAICLPSGRGPEFGRDMDQLIEDVCTVLPRAFESDDYTRRSQSVEEEIFKDQQAELEVIHKKAEENDLDVVATPGGLLFNLTKDGVAIGPEEISKLPQEEQDRLQKLAQELQQEIIRVMQQAPQAQRRARRAQKELVKDIARQTFEPLIDELLEKYEGITGIITYLESVKQDLMEHAEQLVELHRAGQLQASPSQEAMAKRALESSLLRTYRVNVLVTHDPKGGAPVIYEDNPTHRNMTGRVEYLAELGMLVTDFSLIKAGTLHRANGGYLIIEAHRLLLQPYAWDTLKRALRSKEILTEPLGAALGLVSTVSLEPEPIPLDVKLVLLGDPFLYYLLHAYDPDFPEIVKVPADFETDMDRGPEENLLYARLIGTLSAKEGLRPFSREAVARIIEHGSRMAGHSRKISVHMRGVMDILNEADHGAGKEKHEAVRPEDVQNAIDAQLFRSDRMQKRMQENIETGVILIDTDGEAIGQINGLAVFPFGDVYFGQPSRITARTRIGAGKVVDIEREVELGGPTHSMGVLILQGYLTGRYAQEVPLSLSASLVFEQSYGGVSGDSASAAELFALLSAISGLPLKQSFAVTGSVNQHGHVQAIGAVNEKIEGFFDVCKLRGLTGEQGVLIPASNVQHLMLRRDVIDAVEEGKFHVYSIETIDQGMELLTGIPSGELGEDNVYPEGTVNWTITSKLKESADKLKNFSAADGGKDASPSAT